MTNGNKETTTKVKSVAYRGAFVAMKSKKQSNLFAFFGKANTPKNQIPKSTQDALTTPPTATSSRSSRSPRSADAKRLKRRILDDDSDADA
jgi:hypothetical protein